MTTGVSDDELAVCGAGLLAIGAETATELAAEDKVRNFQPPIVEIGVLRRSKWQHALV